MKLKCIICNNKYKITKKQYEKLVKRGVVNDEENHYICKKCRHNNINVLSSPIVF